jgi:hypothetical protein
MYLMKILFYFMKTFAKGLEQLLTFEGDVESTFCRDFVGEYEAFGELQRIPLVPNGQNIPVTKANREGSYITNSNCLFYLFFCINNYFICCQSEYVSKYVNFVLTVSIAEQFDSFKRGFYHVCGGNALSVRIIYHYHSPSP